MKYTIESLNEQNIKAENDGIMDLKELLATNDFWAIMDSNTAFQFDDNIQNRISLIHTDANGQKCKKDFLLPNGVTYNTIINKIRHFFD